MTHQILQSLKISFKSSLLCVLLCAQPCFAQMTHNIDSLYHKVQTGDFDVQSYLRATINKEYVNEEFIKLLNGSEFDVSYLFFEGLANNIISESYPNQILMHSPDRMEKAYFEGEIYWYTNFVLNDSSSIFFFCKHDSNSGKYHFEQYLSSSLETISRFKLKIFRLNESLVMLFDSPRNFVIHNLQNGQWATIDRVQDEYQNLYQGVYFNCRFVDSNKFTCDERTFSSKFEKKDTLFSSSYQLIDIDSDNKLEIVWIGAVMGKIVYVTYIDENMKCNVIGKGQSNNLTMLSEDEELNQLIHYSLIHESE